MVEISDYGSLGKPSSRASIARSNMKLYAGVIALAAAALVAISMLATQDDGMATLAELNRQEMNSMLARAKTMSTAQLQKEVSELEAEKQDGGSMRMQSLVSENDAANPEGGVLENVPSTVVAPVPGPPDFNGASAVVARLPNIGFAPSMLTEKGFETRGSFTIRKSRAGESFYLRVYGKLNHNIRCTLRGYRNLMGDFTGNTIYTGFKKIYTGKSQLQTGHIPRGIVGEFDIMTCRDLGNGEVQYFRIRYG